MVRAARLVTIVGPGGVGKTRLATRLAHQVVRVFPHGVVWVDLAAQRDPGALASEVASALGVEPQGQPALEAIAAYLASRRLLLVLDNCEHLADACSDLLTSLLPDATDLRVVATSRQPLKVTGEHVMSLEPLAVPTPEEVAAGGVGHVEAVALLVDRARVVDAGFRLDSPATPSSSPAWSVARRNPLGDRAGGRPAAGAVGQSAGGAPGRPLRTAVCGNARDLAAPPDLACAHRVELRPVLAGRAGALGPDVGLRRRRRPRGGGVGLRRDRPTSALELLAGLVDKSVVTVSQTDGRVRFRMLETIREYGAERLAERGETEPMRDRHRDHYLASARESRAEWFGPDQLELARAHHHRPGQPAREPSTTRSACRTTARQRWSWRARWRGTGSLPVRSTREHGGSRGRWATSRPTRQTASPTLLRALADAVHLCAERNDVDAAPAARPARRRRCRHPSPPLQTERPGTWRRLSWRPSPATTTAPWPSDHQALREFRAAGDLLRQVEVLQGIAIITDVLGRPAEAAAVLEEAMRLCDTSGERFERRAAMQFYGVRPPGLGRYEQALQRATSKPDRVAGPASRPTWPKPCGRSPRLHAAPTRAAARPCSGRARADLGTSSATHSSPYTRRELRRLRERGSARPSARQAFRTAYDEGYAMTSRGRAVRSRRGDDRQLVGQRPAAGASQLSKREQQVAELVARGLVEQGDRRRSS